MNTVVLLAAGSSTRAGQDKLWADVFGRPLWTLAVETFATHPQIDRVILVVRPGDHARFETAVPPDVQIVAGKDTRMGSFKAGLAAVGPLSKDNVILDHNAANPHVTAEEISAVITAAQEHGAAAVAQPAVDTVIQVDDEGFARANIARDKLRLMQTPQAVRGDVLTGMTLADATDLTTALLEHTPVKILPADPRNKKITYASDLPFATYLGEDSHRFSDEGTLTLGGLTLPEHPAMLANSDGDVILHAIGRALAQAQGRRFSEVADPLCESGDRNSAHYLDPLMEGLTLLEASINLEGARPHIDSLPLSASLAKLLRIPEDRIHISAMSGEDLTPFGRGEGLRCSAVLTIVKKGIE